MNGQYIAVEFKKESDGRFWPKADPDFYFNIFGLQKL